MRIRWTSTVSRNLLLAYMTAMVLPLQAQVVPRNPVLEYCTGTWCQWCPCGEDIIEHTILPNIPNAIIIGYHGPANSSSEPFSFFAGNAIISALGFFAYPTGLVDRTTSSPIDRNIWYSSLSTRLNTGATTTISITKAYNEITRTLSGTVSVSPVYQLTGMYRLNLILLEDSLIYPQTGNTQCPGSAQWVHNHVVRAMINGYLGEDLNTASPWGTYQIISKTLNYVIPADFVARRCRLVAIVYRVDNQLSAGEIQQAQQWQVTNPATTVKEQPAVSSSFAISQNYPNPFNPSTEIQFSLPQKSHVTLTVFDLLGREAATLVSEELSAGSYTTRWDAAGMPSGVYFYRLQAGEFVETKKLLLLR